MAVYVLSQDNPFKFPQGAVRSLLASDEIAAIAAGWAQNHVIPNPGWNDRTVRFDPDSGALVDADARPILIGAVTGGGIVERPAGTSIVLDGAADYAPLTIAGATTIAVSGTTRGAAAQMMVLANGTHVPTITGADEWGSSFGYLNTSGVPNRLDAWFDGFSRRYAWSQQMTPSVIDLAAPTLSTAAVNGASLVLTYSEALNATAPAASAWSVVGAGGVTQTPSAVSISGSAVTLTLGTPAVNGNTVTISYTVPGSNPIRDTAGNSAAALSAQAVTNSTGGAVIRLTTLANITESGDASGWSYTGTSGAFDTQLGVSSLSLPAAGDGSITLPVQTVPVSTQAVLIGFSTAATNAGYASIPYQASIGATYVRAYSGSTVSATASLTPTTSTRVQIARAGSTITLQYSTDSGANWTTLHTWSGASTARLYVHLNISAPALTSGPITGSGLS